jgi:hypothetical protein
MARIIISMKSVYGYAFPPLPQKFLEEETEYQGMTFPIGHLDPIWEKESRPIELLVRDNKRCYYSIPDEYTSEILNSTIDLETRTLDDYDIEFEEDFAIELIEEIIKKFPDYKDVDKLKELGLFYNIKNIDLIMSQLKLHTNVGIASTSDPVGIAST